MSLWKKQQGEGTEIIKHGSERWDKRLSSDNNELADERQQLVVSG